MPHRPGHRVHDPGSVLIFRQCLPSSRLPHGVVSRAEWKTRCGLDIISMIRKMSLSHKWIRPLNRPLNKNQDHRDARGEEYFTEVNCDFLPCTGKTQTTEGQSSTDRQGRKHNISKHLSPGQFPQLKALIVSLEQAVLHLAHGKQMQR